MNMFNSILGNELSENFKNRYANKYNIDSETFKEKLYKVYKSTRDMFEGESATNENDTIELIMEENVDIIIPENLDTIESEISLEPNRPSANQDNEDIIVTITDIHSPQSPVLLSIPQENAGPNQNSISIS